MTETWSKCTMAVPSSLADAFAWLLAQSLDHPIEIQDLSTMSRWHDVEKLGLVASFDGLPPASLEEAVANVSAQLGLDSVAIHIESVNDTSWKEGWKAFFEPQCIAETLWIYPPWKSPPVGKYAIQIEPGMAFGTGTHETTRMMLEMMLRHMENIPPSAVLDVGSGSGILAIASSLFGHETEGIELDPVAVENAKHNLKLNQCESIEMKIGEISKDTRPRSWVLVNILAKIILSIANRIDAVAEEHLLLSGFLQHQRSAIIKAFSEFEIIDEANLGPWGCLYLKRRSA